MVVYAYPQDPIQYVSNPVFSNILIVFPAGTKSGRKLAQSLRGEGFEVEYHHKSGNYIAYVPFPSYMKARSLVLSILPHHLFRELDGVKPQSWARKYAGALVKMALVKMSQQVEVA